MPEGGFKSSLTHLVATLTAPFQAAARAPRSTGAHDNQAPPVTNNYRMGDSNAIPGAPEPPRNIWQFEQTFQPSEAMFGPGMPLLPSQRENVRRWDYNLLWNTVYTPRSFELASYDKLRWLAQNYDILRLAIETRKDQVDGLSWKITPINPKNTASADTDARIQKLTEFWMYPDGRTYFHVWLRQALEEVMVVDAPAFEIRHNRAGEITGFDLIDGATIKVLLDETGRRPVPPNPAYQQVIHGRPWALMQDGSRLDLPINEEDIINEFNDGEIIYMPRNPRVYHGYGFSPVEQIVTTINIGLRRQQKQLYHFTIGNIPTGLINTPEGWSPDQTQEYQKWWDTYFGGNTGNQTKLVWAPAGATYQEFSPPPLKDEFDEWLARIVSFAFSLPPTWAVRQMNRANAQQAQDTAREEGLLPLLNWCKRLIDFCIQRRMGHPDLEFVWQDVKPVDPKVQAEVIDTFIKNGSMTHNEARDQLGLDPIPEGNDAMIITASGPVLLRDVAALSDRTANPPTPAPLGGGAGEGGPPEEGSGHQAGGPAPPSRDGGGNDGNGRQQGPGRPEKTDNVEPPDKRTNPDKAAMSGQKPEVSEVSRELGSVPQLTEKTSIEGVPVGFFPEVAGPDAQAPDGPSLSQAMAGYLDHPVGGEKCGDCTMFRAPYACTLVQGHIWSEGHCHHFDDGEGPAAKAADPFWAWRATALAGLDAPGD